MRFKFILKMINDVEVSLIPLKCSRCFFRLGVTKIPSWTKNTLFWLPDSKLWEYYIPYQAFSYYFFHTFIKIRSQRQVDARMVELCADSLCTSLLEGDLLIRRTHVRFSFDIFKCQTVIREKPVSAECPNNLLHFLCFSTTKVIFSHTDLNCHLIFCLKGGLGEKVQTSVNSR